MIDEALTYVAKTLNEQLSNQFDIDTETVVINSLVEVSGNAPLKNQNKMVLTLINLEHETSKQFYGGYTSGNSATKVSKTQPTVRFNLDVLFTANFDVYNEALKFLSTTIAFFQTIPTFTRALFPDMPDSLEQLQFEVENASYDKTHNLWSALGAKYQPSIIYKIRHVTIDSSQVYGKATRVQAMHGEVAP